MLPMYDTKTFNQVFENVESFKDMIANDFGSYAANVITEVNQEKLYWLLYARYGNTHICNLSVNQFKAKLVAIIFQKGPTWQKELSLQETIRTLTEEDLREGAKAIYNMAANPETAPGPEATEEIGYVNTQNVSKHKKSKLDGYSYLMELLKNDVTESFILSFRVLFSKFARPIRTAIYENEIEIEDEEEETEETL